MSVAEDGSAWRLEGLATWGNGYCGRVQVSGWCTNEHGEGAGAGLRQGMGEQVRELLQGLCQVDVKGAGAGVGLWLGSWRAWPVC